MKYLKKFNESLQDKNEIEDLFLITFEISLYYSAKWLAMDTPYTI